MIDFPIRLPFPIFCLFVDIDQPCQSQNAEANGAQQWQLLGLEFHRAGFQFAAGLVESRQTVPGTRDQVEKLGARVEEVEHLCKGISVLDSLKTHKRMAYLWQKEEQQGFGESTGERTNSNCHPSPIAVGVADKSLGRVLVEEVERRGGANEGEDEAEGEHLVPGLGRVDNAENLNNLLSLHPY